LIVVRIKLMEECLMFAQRHRPFVDNGRRLQV
jgi:hypothetical protein